MDFTTATDTLHAAGFNAIITHSRFEFTGGERVRVMHLTAPKSGVWMISLGVAVRTEWVGGTYGYDMHVIKLDSGEELTVISRNVVYANSITQEVYNASFYREVEEDECYGCDGIGECFCGSDMDYVADYEDFDALDPYDSAYDVY